MPLGEGGGGTGGGGVAGGEGVGVGGTGEGGIGLMELKSSTFSGVKASPQFWKLNNTNARNSRPKVVRKFRLLRFKRPPRLRMSYRNRTYVTLVHAMVLISK
jgi:hypothetical protein